MASAFSHALVALTIGSSYSREFRSRKFLLLGALCAVLPDADVITFSLGIPYSHLLGHRGFFHSLLFSFLVAFAVSRIFYSGYPLRSGPFWVPVLYFFLCTASHGVLDAITSGGLGVAFLSPFDTGRYFFPWRPVQVSPIGAGAFFSEWGIRVIKSELIWIALPCLVYVLLVFVVRKTRRKF